MMKFMASGKQNQLDHADENVLVETKVKCIQGLIFTLLIIGTLIFVVIRLSDPMTLPIRHVSINGDFVHLSPVSLQERASSVVRGGFFNVNVETIQEVVSNEPWVKEIMVSRVWPDRISVDIKEQEAVAIWKDNALLNADSFIFNPELSTFPEGLPYLSGPENSNSLVMEQLYKITEILPEPLKVKELHLSERRSWKLILDNNVKLQIGKKNILEKVNQFIKYYPGLYENNERKVNYVDLRYTNGFVTGWKTNNETELMTRQGKNGEEI